MDGLGPLILPGTRIHRPAEGYVLFWSYYSRRLDSLSPHHSRSLSQHPFFHWHLAAPHLGFRFVPSLRLILHQAVYLRQVHFLLRPRRRRE